jgi:hypothetical protein
MSTPLPISDSLTKFCKVFNAELLHSDRKFYKPITTAWVDSEDPRVNFKVEEHPMVAIHLPREKLKEFLSVVDEQRYRELEIRDQVPAVKKAYEHYKMLLQMCGGDYDDRY